MVQRITLLIVVSLSVVSPAFCQGFFRELPEKPVHGNPDDALKIALADAITVGDAAVRFRYLWIPDSQEKWAAAVAYAVNECASHSSLIIHPKLFAGGQLMRWDLLKLGGNEEGYQKIVSTWDSLARTEPYFTYREKETTHFGGHVNETAALKLAEITDSAIPIMRADWFLEKLTTTLDGGKYVEFMRFDVKPETGTAQEAFLKQFGANEKLVAGLKSDQKVAMFRSKVTGKPRAVILFSGSGGRVGINQSLVAITQDIGDEDVEAETNPIQNLLNFQFRATEIIIERSNGTHAYGLFDAKGAWQNSVPDNIAKDHTIPAPHTARLEPGISCIRCHRTKGQDGWKPIPNDVQTLLRGQLDVFGEKPDGRPIAKTIERLAGLYSGNLDKPLRRARNDYLETILRIAGGDDAQETTDNLVLYFNSYRYSLITPRAACDELGIVVGDGTEAKNALRRAIPYTLPGVDDISPEHPTIGALCAGIAVNRKDFEQVFILAMERIQQKRGAEK